MQSGWRNATLEGGTAAEPLVPGLAYGLSIQVE